MKRSQTSLTPVGLDGDQWRKEFVDISLGSNDRVINYSGYVLTSMPRATHVIEFEFETSALRPAEIEIPLLISASASVKLSIEDEITETVEFPASPESATHVRLITKNVTKWSEARETSRVRLVISYHGEHATTTVVLGPSSELGAKVLQRWTASYSLQSLSFFALAWSCIVGLAILILAHIKPLGDTFRFYAVLIAAFTWLAGAIGLPDVAKIPLRPMLRRLYAKTRSPLTDPSLVSSKRRTAVLGALLLSFMLITSGVAVVIYCLSVRQYYSSLVRQALGETNDQIARSAQVNKALSLLPWRKEAQIMLESEAYGRRNPEDMSPFREYVKNFALQPDVKKSIMEAPEAEHLPFVLNTSGGNSFLSDPVVWYASTIIEGEDNKETALMNEAIAMLANRKDPIAQIQLWNTRLGILASGEPEESELENTAAELLRQLQNHREKRSTHVYQAASDTLAGYYLAMCDPDSPSASLESAARWYKEELSARKQQTTETGEPLWLRPPHKLMLFYMFASRWNMKGEAVDMVKCFLNSDDCQPPLEGDRRCDFGPTFDKELWTPNGYYQNENAWTKRTVSENGLKLNVVIEESLKKGWRY